MKVFLFFTESYIWDYNYHWWFHVAPYLTVKTPDGVTEKVIDYSFFYGPTDMKDWTDYFIIPQTVCPTVKKFSDYSNHEHEAYCYLIKTPMYFWQPWQLEDDLKKQSFDQDEVDTAYWQAF